MVAVAYRRWSFTRGTNRKALSGKILVFWIGGRLWEVVARGGWTVFVHLIAADLMLLTCTMKECKGTIKLPLCSIGVIVVSYKIFLIPVLW